METTLFIGQREIHNIFQLLGEDEDSISLALSWALRNAPAFTSTFLRRLLPEESHHDAVQIRIHRYEEGSGITDIELIIPGTAHVIIEAKRGWVLPGSSQLEMYARRESFVSNAAPCKKLVTLSECSQSYAKAHLPFKSIGSVPVEHIAWDDILTDIGAAEVASGNVDKRLLRDFKQYMRNVMSKQNKDSNLVYVVSLASSTNEEWKTSWIDIVMKHGRYFHPVGDRWPKDPPNYIGFRYYGKLQSIHHVKEYEVVENLQVACPGIPSTPVDPHYLYKLGPAIVPSKEVKTGSIYPSGRVWCAIDALLTCDSVSGARDITQARK